MTDESSRRIFLKGAALGMAPAVLPALGANDKINVGWIGTGSRGMYVMNMMYAAVPDQVVVSGSLRHLPGRAQPPPRIMSRPRAATRPRPTPTTANCSGSLDRRGLHHHARAPAPRDGHRGAARRQEHLSRKAAGPHHRGGRGDRPRGRQSPARSSRWARRTAAIRCTYKAKEMIAAGHDRRGPLRARLLVSQRTRQRAGLALSDSRRPEQRDRRLGQVSRTAPRSVPFDAHRYRQWRLYWDYSGGISTDLLVHQTDITNFVCGKTVPHSCMASGGIYRWTAPDDDREVPDTLSAIYDYPDSKFHLNYSPATSATPTSATASSSWATRAPSRCSTASS